MDLETIARYDAARDLGDKAFRSACYAPYVSLYFTTTGRVLACCKNGTFTLGDVATQSLQEIWGGANVQVLRDALRGYSFDRDCAFCEWEIAGGSVEHATPRMFDELPVTSVAPPWPSQIEFEGSTTCNFECVMCNGYTSSAIRQNRERLPPLPRPYGDRFFEELRPFLPHLQRARFFGGEPFLTRECHRVWDLLIEDGLTPQCHVTTNGSQFNRQVERVLDALPFSIVVSIDGATKATVESIRVNCRYEQLVDNIHRFRAYASRRQTSCRLAFCLMRQNWQEFGDLLLWAEALGLEVLVNTVVEPSFCSLYSLPSRELAAVVERMEQQEVRVGDRLALNRGAWRHALVKLRGAADVSQRAALSDVLSCYYVIDGPLRRAEALAREQRHADAIAVAAQVPAADPDVYYAHTVRAYSQCVLNELADAEQSLTTAIGITDRLPAGQLHLARVRLKQNRRREAIRLATQALACAPPEEKESYQAAELLGLAYVSGGEIRRAAEVLQPIADLQVGDAQVRGIAYPESGLRPELLSETHVDPRGWRGRAVVAATSSVVSALKATRRWRLQAEDSPRRRPASSGPGLPDRRSQGWSLRLGEGNIARLNVEPNGFDYVRIDVEQGGASALYDVQVNRVGFVARRGRWCQVVFSARAAAAGRPIAVGFARAHAPWSGLGFYRELSLSTEWQTFTDEFVVGEDEPNARLHFDVGPVAGAVEFREVRVVQAVSPAPRLP